MRTAKTETDLINACACFNRGALSFSRLMDIAGSAEAATVKSHAGAGLAFKFRDPELQQTLGLRYFTYCDRLGCLGVCDADGTGQRSHLQGAVGWIVVVDDSDRVITEIPV